MGNKILKILVLVMLFALCLQHVYYSHDSERVVVEENTDTLYLTKIDTIKVVEHEIVRDSVIDTLYVETEGKDEISLPISQRYYGSKDYRIWISGFEPVLDSVYVFKDKEYITIEKKVTERLYERKTDFYLNGGFTMIGNDIMPSVGVTMTTPRRIMIGANVGMFNSKVAYSLNLGYRL